MKFPINSYNISEILECNIVGQDQLIYSFNRLELANQGDITFYASDDYKELVKQSYASCILVPVDFGHQPQENQCFIYSSNPRADFIKLVRIYAEKSKAKQNFISPLAVIHENATVAKNCYIGPYCIIEAHVIIEDGAELIANVFVGKNSRIGTNTTIFSNVSIYSNTIIGKDCVIHSGTVIGADGFGYEELKDKSYIKIPQVGYVVIGNSVEIGANSCIDRAFVGPTIISDGVKIDNLVQIAHNCTIGENTAIASQTGIAGTSNIGKRVRMGGQVGIAGHLSIADDVTIIAQSGASKSIPQKGVYFGSPVKDVGRAFKIEAILRKLPELAVQIDANSKEIMKLKS